MLNLSKLYKTIVLLILSINPCFASEENEVMPANRTQLSVLLGSYALTAPGASISSVGAFTVGFTYRFFEKISATAAYNNLMTLSGSLSSVVSGFDIGATYCFWVCSAMRQKLGDAALVVSWSPWGLQLGAGFAQRSVSLSTVSVGFAGPYGKAEVNYMLGDRLKILGSAQYTSMSNSTKSISQITYQLGLGFDFGENVYNSARKRQN
jgi:hypothetical protein